MQAGDDFATNFDAPECLMGTLFRRVASGSDVDLSAANTSSAIKGLFFSVCNRFDGRGSEMCPVSIFGMHLDTPSYSLGEAITYSVGVAVNRDDAEGCAFRLNRSFSGEHDAHASSIIKATEIPQ